MFTIIENKFGSFNQIVLQNTLTQEYCGIIPDYGATITKLGLSNGSVVFDIVDGCKDDFELINNSAYKGCNLIPFPNRIAAGKYSFKGESYQLDTNNGPNALHGLAFDKKFEIISKEADENCASIALRFFYDNNHKGYPFQLEIIVKFSLDVNGLRRTVSLINNGDSVIPVADGWHLYFKTVTPLAECLLQFASDSVLKVDETLIPTGDKIAFSKFNNPTKINDDQIDHCFCLSEQSNVAKVLLIDKLQRLTIVAWQDMGNSKYNYVQIYIPPSRTSIAIEPMTCVPNAFNNQEGIILLAPHQRIDLNCGVSVDKI